MISGYLIKKKTRKRRCSFVGVFRGGMRIALLVRI